MAQPTLNFRNSYFSFKVILHSDENACSFERELETKKIGFSREDKNISKTMIEFTIFEISVSDLCLIPFKSLMQDDQSK